MKIPDYRAFDSSCKGYGDKRTSSRFTLEDGTAWFLDLYPKGMYHPYSQLALSLRLAPDADPSLRAFKVPFYSVCAITAAGGDAAPTVLATATNQVFSAASPSRVFFNLLPAGLLNQGAAYLQADGSLHLQCRFVFAPSGHCVVNFQAALCKGFRELFASGEVPTDFVIVSPSLKEFQVGFFVQTDVVVILRRHFIGRSRCTAS